MIDLSVDFAGVKFKNPIVAASGCFGFGREYGEYYDLTKLGGICVKGLTLEPRPGNPPPRIAETPMGVLNSVGLQNPGVDAFIRDELPELLRHKTVIIANIAGDTIDEYAQIAGRLAGSGVDIIEINVSCPNVLGGGLPFGTSPDAVAAVTAVVIEKAKMPVMVKLSPNVTDIVPLAKAAETVGAGALSLINTLLGMRIDTGTRRPVLHNNTGGLSGPAVFPVAVRMVWQAASAVKIPILGMGGVMTGVDAAEMMLAGASLVGVGTACFDDPYAPVRIINELVDYMKYNKIDNIADITGKVILN